MIGTTVFVTWVYTDWSFLILAGVLTIVLGFLTFLTGLCFLWFAWERGANPTSLFACALPLIANFPVAACFAISAIAIDGRYTVVVINESPEAIMILEFEGPDLKVELGSIPPGGTVTQYLYFHGDGELRCVYRTPTGKMSATIESYVTGGMGGHAELRIRSPDEIIIETRLSRSP